MLYDDMCGSNYYKYIEIHVSNDQMLTAAAFCAGLIPDIIDAFPDVKIAGSKVALMYLKGLTNRDFTQNPVKGGDKIELGKGTTFKTCFHLPCSFGLAIAFTADTAFACSISVEQIYHSALPASSQTTAVCLLA